MGTHYQRNSCITIVVAALFTMTEIWNQRRCSPSDDWIKNMYTQWNYGNEILLFALMWLQLEEIMLSEISWLQKDKFHGVWERNCFKNSKRKGIVFFQKYLLGMPPILRKATRMMEETIVLHLARGTLPHCQSLCRCKSYKILIHTVSCGVRGNIVECLTSEKPNINIYLFFTDNYHFYICESIIIPILWLSLSHKEVKYFVHYQILLQSAGP